MNVRNDKALPHTTGSHVIYFTVHEAAAVNWKIGNEISRRTGAPPPLCHCRHEEHAWTFCYNLTDMNIFQWSGHICSVHEGNVHTIVTVESLANI